MAPLLGIGGRVLANLMYKFFEITSNLELMS